MLRMLFTRINGHFERNVPRENVLLWTWIWYLFSEHYVFFLCSVFFFWVKSNLSLTAVHRLIGVLDFKNRINIHCSQYKCKMVLTFSCSILWLLGLLCSNHNVIELVEIMLQSLINHSSLFTTFYSMRKKLCNEQPNYKRTTHISKCRQMNENWLDSAHGVDNLL